MVFKKKPVKKEKKVEKKVEEVVEKKEAGLSKSAALAQKINSIIRGK